MSTCLHACLDLKLNISYNLLQTLFNDFYCEWASKRSFVVACLEGVVKVFFV